MAMNSASRTARVQDMPNGPAAAAILAAGIGCFMVALFALLGDKIAAFKSMMIFYKPTGPLSGVTATISGTADCAARRGSVSRAKAPATIPTNIHRT